MSGAAEDLLTRGIAAAKANQKDEARHYLEWVLQTDADRRQQVQAWLWLSGVMDDPKEKRNCLEEVLVRDPSNRMARRGLAMLDGRLKPEDLVDPNQRRPAAPTQAVTAQRMVCPKCGGKMAYAPDGRSLRCEYCAQQERKQALSASQGAELQEHDFVVALATAKGHTHPVKMHAFTCEGCGADFILAPDVLSLNCSYCGSAHVADVSEVRELIPPEGVIPFAIRREEAQRAFREWLVKKKMRKAKITPVRGVYLPAWTFDMSGEIRWVCYVNRDEGPSVDIGGIPISLGGGSSSSRKLVKEEGTHLVYEDDLLILATKKLTVDLVKKEVDKFLLGDVMPYEHGYLADWPAEAYQITVADASLMARGKMLKKAKSALDIRLSARLESVRDLQLNTSGVTVDSFKLILLPFWIARYRHQDKVYYLLVNGQTGKVRAQMPRNLIQKFFDGIFD
jgi:DNA-directed RNA polymerase subunit RPC12/RpoP